MSTTPRNLQLDVPSSLSVVPYRSCQVSNRCHNILSTAHKKPSICIASPCMCIAAVRLSAPRILCSDHCQSPLPFQHRGMMIRKRRLGVLSTGVGAVLVQAQRWRIVDTQGDTPEGEYRLVDHSCGYPISRTGLEWSLRMHVHPSDSCSLLKAVRAAHYTRKDNVATSVLTRACLGGAVIKHYKLFHPRSGQEDTSRQRSEDPSAVREIAMTGSRVCRFILINAPVVGPILRSGVPCISLPCFPKVPSCLPRIASGFRPGLAARSTPRARSRCQQSMIAFAGELIS
jgi:hypothetical protein